MVDFKTSISKEFTDVWSQQPNGTVHSYFYFKNIDSNMWTYNVDFHADGGFAPVQLNYNKRVKIQKAINDASKIFENTTYLQQPYRKFIINWSN